MRRGSECYRYKYVSMNNSPAAAKLFSFFWRTSQTHSNGKTRTRLDYWHGYAGKSRPDQGEIWICLVKRATWATCKIFITLFFDLFDCFLWFSPFIVGRPAYVIACSNWIISSNRFWDPTVRFEWELKIMEKWSRKVDHLNWFEKSTTRLNGKNVRLE